MIQKIKGNKIFFCGVFLIILNLFSPMPNDEGKSKRKIK